MVMNKVGLNISVLSNLKAPNITISSSAEQIAEDIKASAASQTLNYYGLGFMITLFIFLVWKIGRGSEFLNEQFGNTRSVGVSAGIVSMIGVWALMLGFFTNYYYVVVFMGISTLSWIIMFLGSR